MKKSLAVFILISCLLCQLYPWRAQACGPQLEVEDTRLSLFQQQLAGNDGLALFYYTEHFLNGGPGSADNRRNCNEWAAYTWGAATVRDIDSLMYQVPADHFIDALITHNWQGFGNNTFLRWLQKPANKAAYDYFIYAKLLERQYSVSGMDNMLAPWQVVPPRASAAGEYYITPSQALEKAGSALPLFIRERYAFQAIKEMYYAVYYSGDTIVRTANGGVKDNSALIAAYGKYLGNSKSIVADWARLYYALSFADRNMRARQMIKTFHSCDEKRGFIYNHLTTADAERLLATETDRDMLAATHAYLGVKTPGRAFRHIQAVNKYAPGSDYLKLLIVREISKLDDWLLSPRLTGFMGTHWDVHQTWYSRIDHGDTATAYYVAKNLRKDKAYLRQLAALLTGISNGSRNRGFFDLALTHLYQLEGDFSAAAPYLARLHRFRDADYERQRLVENAINIIYTQDIGTSAVQQQLCSILTRLQPPPGAEDEDEWYYRAHRNNLHSELCLMLSKQYQQQGNTVFAGLMFKKAGLLVNEYYGYPRDNDEFGYSYIDYYDKYATPADIDSLLAFFARKRKKPFEQMLMPAKKGDTRWHLELKGTLLLRQGRYEEALAVFERLPDTYWQTTYEFRNYLKRTNITSAGSLLPVPSGRQQEYVMVSKKDALRDIVDLYRRLAREKSDASIASICFMLGNAHLNMTYYGPQWMMFSYGWSCQEPGEYDWASFRFHPVDDATEDVYYGCSRAREMYQRALAHAGHDKELTAQILLMLAYATTNGGDGPRSRAQGKWWEANTAGPGMKYLRMLKKKCSKTRTYEYAIGTCPDVT